MTDLTDPTSPGVPSAVGPEPEPEPEPEPPPAAPREPRQRWRVTYARDPVATEAVGRAGLDAWQQALAGSGLPLAGLEPGGAGRARVAFGAPLPAAASGDAELADLWLLERMPLWAVRDALQDRLPAGHRWIRAEDVWLGAPALAGRVVAADWRVTVRVPGSAHAPSPVAAGIVAEPPVEAPVETAAEAAAEITADIDRLRASLVVAAGALIAAATLPRVRLKGTTEKRYDLRPLVTAVSVDDERGAEGGILVRIRTRFDPELGAGRPDEVLACLSDLAERAIEVGPVARERLVLADDQARPAAEPSVGRRPLSPRSRLGLPGRR